MPDQLNIEILDDGTVVVSSDQISAGNHRGAEELLKVLETLMGGESIRTKRKVQQTQHHIDRTIQA